MKINVTGKDIAQGEPCSTQTCPIALALHRALGIDDEICVIGDFIRVGQILRFKVPRIAERFIDKFDSGKKVKPFTFLLKELL